MDVMDLSQLNAKVQLLMAVEPLFDKVICPPNPVPQSLVTSKEAVAADEAGGGMVSTIVPVPAVVASVVPTAPDRLTWNVRLLFAAVSGLIGTEIDCDRVPGLNVSVPEVAV